MTRHPGALALFATLALPACGAPAPDSDDPITPDPPVATASANPAASASPPSSVPGKWNMVSSGEGDGLFFGVVEGEPAKVHLFCPNGAAPREGLLVNVNAFTPVGSEERMSFGSGGTVVTLVADPSGDARRGGVSVTGPVPAELRCHPDRPIGGNRRALRGLFGP
ncbi:hypothetical protein [Croceicoccus sp. BE223]|uniref:hypothetical protein n=1 Tax=Croceicoccus sp. BE223 TaxID=2817716 RepID=UPI0028558E10|nr:hypothetical protein [Croceicoccus sp. BE223]MDR7101389.1 hypothetical protein [Croceicoccus sp. BE223]